MTPPAGQSWLPGSGVEVAFGDIASALSGLWPARRERAGPAPAGGEEPTPGRIVTMTLVVVGGAAELAEAATILDELVGDVAARTLLIPDTEGEGALRARISARCGLRPGVNRTVCAEQIALAGRGVPAFLGNIVAALRLSDLPTFLWWRTSRLDPTRDLATFADRLVYDVPDAVRSWAAASAFIAANRPPWVTELRWTALTQWRAVVAQLFDVPEVGALFPRIDRVVVTAADRAAGRLLAGWLASALGWRIGDSRPAALAGDRTVRVEFPAPGTHVGSGSVGGAPDAERTIAGVDRGLVESLTLEADGGRATIAVRVVPSGTCLRVEATADGVELVSRIVARQPESVAALLGHELRIRGRDRLFERALAVAISLAG